MHMYSCTVVLNYLALNYPAYGNNVLLVLMHMICHTHAYVILDTKGSSVRTENVFFMQQKVCDQREVRLSTATPRMPCKIPSLQVKLCVYDGSSLIWP